MSKQIINEQVQTYLDNLYTKDKLKEQRYSVLKEQEVITELGPLLGLVLAVLTGGAITSAATQSDMKTQIDTARRAGDEAGWKAGYQAGTRSGEGTGYVQGAGDAITGAAAVALAAAITTVAYKVYKAKFSKAARACVQYKGIQKEECMLKFKKDALQAKIKMLQKGAAKLCSKNKNPGECRARIQAKIADATKELSSKK